MLAWTGQAESLEEFLGGFVLIGGGDPEVWNEERLSPLADYIRSLRPPEPPSALTQIDDDVYLAGELAFAESCLSCHHGPRGSGTELYTYEELGTDPAMTDWGQGAVEDLPPKLGVKAPRLVGLWSMDAFLHNGSVSSLEELLCVDGERPPSLPIPQSNAGHRYGCDDLTADEKAALIAYLKAH